MTLREILNQAIYSLGINRLRSLLTIMGVAVGVFSIIAVMTSLEAIDRSIQSGLANLGANTIQIQKNEPTTFGRGHRRNLNANRRDITWQEAQLFRKQMSGKARTIGFIISSRGNQATRANLSTNPDVTITGADEHFATTNGYTIAKGRNLSPYDIRYATNNIMLGSETAETLFPGGLDPIGKTIRIAGNLFTVTGTFARNGAAFGQSQDNFVLIPVTRYLQQIDEKGSIAITVEATDAKTYTTTLNHAIGAMRIARGLSLRDSTDFSIQTSQSLIDSFRSIEQTIGTGAFIISFMALLTAGVGIMNIMLVSVTERTREIGIRKSIGAPKSTILRQFLLEALILSLTGAIAGIITGIAAGNAIALAFGLPLLFPWFWITISVLVCSGIGTAFGIFPAWKAASLDPVDALRSR